MTTDDTATPRAIRRAILQVCFGIGRPIADLAPYGGTPEVIAALIADGVLAEHGQRTEGEHRGRLIYLTTYAGEAELRTAGPGPADPLEVETVGEAVPLEVDSETATPISVPIPDPED